MELYFASSNAGKIDEIKTKLGPFVSIKGLSDLKFTDEIAETGNTLIENARIKAWHIHNLFGVPCFADDTGLMVEALNGNPGVRSARYAGEQNSSLANMKKLLDEMDNQTNRRASFTTIICLVLNKEERIFSGEVNGSIQREMRGSAGFGYDPIFVPDNCSRTFAEMSMAEKNLLSHRARAISSLKEYLLTGIQIA